MWFLLLATCLAQAGEDPLVRLVEAGSQLLQTRAVSIGVEDPSAFFAEPVFRAEIRRVPSCDAPGADTASKTALDVQPGEAILLTATNVSPLHATVNLVEYAADGDFGFYPVHTGGTVPPGATVSDCFRMTGEAGVFALRVVGLPAGKRLDEQYASVLRTERGEPFRAILENDARQRVAAARMGPPARPIDTVLIRVAGAAVAGELETDIVQAALRDRFPSGSGVLAYAPGENGTLVAEWRAAGAEPERFALAIGMEEANRLTADLVFAVAGQDVATRGPQPRGLETVSAAQRVRASGVSFDDAVSAATEALLPGELAERVQGASHVVLLPVGGLGHLPWFALAPGGQALVDSTAITIAPDLAVFARSVPNWKARFRKPLIVGDPTLRATDYPKWSFTGIPDSGVEARAVAKGVRGKALTGDAATHSAVTARATDADLLYFATHGIADPASPMWGSFVALHERPWTAAEVIATDLSGAQLAVLSACQTGLGMDVTGGTIGLARAFYQAGVPRVAMSLWNVNDEGTRQLMLQFLQDAKSAPPHEALRRAAATLKAKGTPPEVWASFLMLGAPL